MWNLIVAYPVLIMHILFFLNVFIVRMLLVDGWFDTKKYFISSCLSYLVYFFPYAIGCQMNNMFLSIGFSNMILSDMYDKVIFVIVPYLWIVYGQISALLKMSWDQNITILITVLGIFVVAWMTNYVTRRVCQQDGIGWGDVLSFAGLAYFLDPKTIVFGVVLSSLLGVFFAFIVFLATRQKIKVFPYIPFLYLGICLLHNQYIFTYINLLFAL
jgi:hypothetical protein